MMPSWKKLKVMKISKKDSNAVKRAKAVRELNKWISSKAEPKQLSLFK